MIRSRLKQIISKALRDSYPLAQEMTFAVDEPGAGINADVASNAALVFAKKMGLPPFQIAQDLAQKLASRKDGNSTVIKSAEATKNGFLNFVLDDSYLRKLTSEVCRQNEKLGPGPNKTTHKVLIEFVSANPTGPLHIGHGRGPLSEILWRASTASAVFRFRRNTM